MVPTSKSGLFQLILMLLYMFCTYEVCVGSDTISLGQSLYVNQSLISKGGIFELGFFAPGTSNNFYIGIWYKKISEYSVVWVANRDTPLVHFSDNSRLLLSEDGNLIIFSDMNISIWSNNISAGVSSSQATKMVLLDTGNFVLSDGFSVIWQSFDHPTDTLLPGGKVGFDKSNTNRTQVLTSWRNPNDPSPGIYSLGMDPTGSAEFFVWRNQSQIIWRSGAWDGHAFRYISESTLFSSRFSFSLVSNEQTTYFTYNISDGSYIYSRHIVDYAGQMKLLIWVEKKQSWAVLLAGPAQPCEVFASCGAFGVCNNNNSRRCECLAGFEPRFPSDWSSNDSSGGCLRRESLGCDKNKPGFKRLTNIRLPAYSQSLDVESRSVCEFACSENCSCTAYANSRRRCLLWNGDLMDLERLSDLVRGEDIYLKSSDLSLDSDSGNKKQLHVPLALSITLPLLICISLVYLLHHIWRKKRNQKEAKETKQNLLLLNLDINCKVNTNNIITGNIMGGKENVIDLPQFSFSSISAATDNFSTANKLGEGGFGPVYKGNLLDGQSVAVKRLSKRSGQGLEELRNETVLIAKLQHRNLVRLLGCCIEQDEKILIYEYMPNKSLDCFLFDPYKRDILDWRRRVHIIEGIAQGLLYLHQHSRLRIVHRDLKASNILLDDGMNPKISDFGMARIFGGDVLQANTHRIVGTYGYMSPEYAMEGLFSIKSDVFSFGVLLLEILSGKKNTGFRHSDCLSLIGYAWELWKNDRALELIEDSMQIPSSFMPLRFIHVGLLCVQESPADRPTMSDVLAMFGSEHIKLVWPKRPAFTSGGSSGSGKDNAKDCSLNDLTDSMMDGR